ncbi:MAG TPA: hypothetical protein VK871_03850 [Candidatus Limnocylindrales bacterium]|nr:hypothetical protein [Candidatus Limnocylindrales bacterium]
MAESAIAVAEPPADPTSATETDPTPAAAERAEASAEAVADVTAEAPPVADAAPAPTRAPAFLTELVRAMHATIDAERERAAEETERRREEHVATIHARRDAETERMRELADEDLSAVDAWAETERERIQAERDRRAAAVRADLELSLTEHKSQIDREIEAVDEAVSAYRAEVDAFFADLDRETDPVAIAQHARRRPEFPTLDAIAQRVAATSPEIATPEVGSAEGAPIEVTTEAAAAEVASPEVGSGEAASPEVASFEVAAPAVGVMDPQATAPAEPWAGWNTGAGESAAMPETVESVESVAVAPAAGEPQSGSVLQSLPISRPMAWLRRDRDAGDSHGGS